MPVMRIPEFFSDGKFIIIFGKKHRKDTIIFYDRLQIVEEFTI